MFLFCWYNVSGPISTAYKNTENSRSRRFTSILSYFSGFQLLQLSQQLELFQDMLLQQD